jgi:hypothetical protein
VVSFIARQYNLLLLLWQFLLFFDVLYNKCDVLRHIITYSRVVKRTPPFTYDIKFITKYFNSRSKIGQILLFEIVKKYHFSKKKIDLCQTKNFELIMRPLIIFLKANATSNYFFEGCVNDKFSESVVFNLHTVLEYKHDCTGVCWDN